MHLMEAREARNYAGGAMAELVLAETTHSPPAETDSLLVAKTQKQEARTELMQRLVRLDEDQR